MWNPFRSKLAASIVGGIENIYMQPGSKVLYLGAASGTTVSHVADLVGPVRSKFDYKFSNRKVQSTLSNSQREVEETSSIWPRKEPM